MKKDVFSYTQQTRSSAGIKQGSFIKASTEMAAGIITVNLYKYAILMYSSGKLAM